MKVEGVCEKCNKQKNVAPSDNRRTNFLRGYNNIDLNVSPTSIFQVMVSGHKQLLLGVIFISTIYVVVVMVSSAFSVSVRCKFRHI